MSINFNFEKSLTNLEQTKAFSQKYISNFKKVIESPDIGFVSTLTNKKLLEDAKHIHQKFSKKTRFFQVGIGGSSLGPEMLTSALSTKNSEVSFEYINNVDPDLIHEQLETVKDEKECLFYAVSKSGSTAETVAALIIVINFLKGKFDIKDDQLKDFIVFCTDESKGDLLKLASELNISTLTVPSNVGGRFSVLTPVGFLPALFANIDCDSLIQSAHSYANTLVEDQESDLYKVACCVAHHQKSQINQTVLMPYSSKLRSFTSWFVQLWAESLGKKLDKNNNVVHTGLTPISAYGSTDQHSQMQLFMEGPKDKLFFLLEVKEFGHDFSLDNSIDLSAFKLLSKSNLSDLMNAEFKGALTAMAENNLPLVHLSINKVNEKSLGELIIFFELLTAFMGEVLEINPFDQPGVELGKVYTKQILSD